MTNRYRSVIDVYELLRRADGHVLLMERANTAERIEVEVLRRWTV